MTASSDETRRTGEADGERAATGAQALPMTHEMLKVPFPERAGAALKDTFLQEALGIATTKFIGLRTEAFAGFPEGDALRDRARAIKEATLLKLDAYLGQLADSVERLGGHRG